MKKWEACRTEAERIYRSRIRDREDVDSANFPIQISLGSIRTEELLADRSIWREWEESISGIEGVHIQTVTRETRKYGTQTLPKYLVLDNWTALLSFIGKEDEYREFRELEKFTRSRIPDLKDWVRSHWEDVLGYKQDWSSIVDVVLYFIENDNSKAELHLREIPISVHTKFIESNSKILKKILDHILPPNRIDWDESNFSLRYRLKRQEETIRFRILDEDLSQDAFMGWNDISLRLSDFSNKFPVDKVQNVFVIENLTSFLSFPSMPNSIAVFGKGFQVNLLRETRWLQEKEVYYWGDMDIQGFQILSMFRSYFPHTKSLLMDRNTWNNHKESIVEGNASPNLDLEFLTKDEKEFCKSLVTFSDNLKTNTQKFFRLEQEKIPISYVAFRIEEYLS